MRGDDSLLDSIEAVEKSALAITDLRKLTAWMQGPLRDLIPHGKALVGFGQVGYSTACIDQVHMVDLAEAYFVAIQSGTRHLSSPVMTNWLARREPQIFVPADFCRIRNGRWLNNLDQYEIENGIFDAAVDCVTGRICFLTLFNVKQSMDAGANVLAQCVTPMLADIWKRVDAGAQTSNTLQTRQSGSQFSAAERNVLRWIRAGKTNWEIARQVGCQGATSTRKHACGRLSLQ
jgi:hypothetical protein